MRQLRTFLSCEREETRKKNGMKKTRRRKEGKRSGESAGLARERDKAEEADEERKKRVPREKTEGGKEAARRGDGYYPNMSEMEGKTKKKKTGAVEASWIEPITLRRREETGEERAKSSKKPPKRHCRYEEERDFCCGDNHEGTLPQPPS